jgi:IstB-like ATP binding protein
VVEKVDTADVWSCRRPIRSGPEPDRRRSGTARRSWSRPGASHPAPRAARLPTRQAERDSARTPGTGKTHISIALGIRACLAGQRVLFRTATEWVALFADAQRQGKLDQELDRLERIPLLICDEVGYIPFDPQAASLMFMLVSRRYERASLIVTSTNHSRRGARSSATTWRPSRWSTG